MRSALELVNMEENPRPKSGESSRKRKRTAGLSVEEREEQLLPNLKPTPGTELRLTELPDKMYPDDATPMEVTQHSLDFSYALEVLINKLPELVENSIFHSGVKYQKYYEKYNTETNYKSFGSPTALK